MLAASLSVIEYIASEMDGAYEIENYVIIYVKISHLRSKEFISMHKSCIPHLGI